MRRVTETNKTNMMMEISLFSPLPSLASDRLLNNNKIDKINLFITSDDTNLWLYKFVG